MVGVMRVVLHTYMFTICIYVQVAVGPFRRFGAAHLFGACVFIIRCPSSLYCLLGSMLGSREIQKLSEILGGRSPAEGPRGRAPAPPWSTAAAAAAVGPGVGRPQKIMQSPDRLYQDKKVKKTIRSL